MSAPGKSLRAQLGLTGNRNRFHDTANGVPATLLDVQSAAIAEKIKKLKDEIERIKQVNREYRKIKYPSYPAQKVYENRRIRLVEIQQEIKALLKAQL